MFFEIIYPGENNNAATNVILRDCFQLERYIIILLLILLVRPGALAQDTGLGAGYQTIVSANPAIAGVEGDGTIRLSYLNFFPGKGYNLQTLYASYDTYVPYLHGGAGVWISNEVQGRIVNDLRGAFSYGYFLRAGDELYITAGLSAGFFHRGFNFSSAVLPDMIDPFLGTVRTSAETLLNENYTIFDLGTGFLFMYRNLGVGIAVNHITQPYLPNQNEQIQRKYVIHSSARFVMEGEKDFLIIPVLYAEFQGDYFLASAGTCIGTENISFNLNVMTDMNKNINLQPGFYVGAGRLQFFYNYRFNILKSNNNLPVSLHHQTGLAFSINTVDKRKTLKTISLPKM